MGNGDATGSVAFLQIGRQTLAPSLRAEIVRAIHTGPKSYSGKDLPNYEEIIGREKALRLHNLIVSGARLDKKSRILADVITPEAGEDERNEFLSWHGKFQWVGDEEFAPKDLVEGSVADVVTALADRKVGQDELRGLVVQKPVKVASAPAAAWETG